MSGHSKWAQIRHKKAGTDARRGAMFSKLSRILALAARDGGPHAQSNIKLRQAIERARSGGMPKDTIERAIQRGVGSDDARKLQAVEYEAYGPGGSAWLIAGLTDNPLRTTREMKHLLEAAEGRLTRAGGVSWLFDRRIAFELPLTNRREALELELIEAGAEDIRATETGLTAIVSVNAAEMFQKRMAERNLQPLSSHLSVIPKQSRHLEVNNRTGARFLLKALRDHPDVTDVWTDVSE